MNKLMLGMSNVCYLWTAICFKSVTTNCIQFVYSRTERSNSRSVVIIINNILPQKSQSNISHYKEYSVNGECFIFWLHSGCDGRLINRLITKEVKQSLVQ